MVAMFNIVRGASHWTPRRLLAASVAPGRRPGRLAGGHVIDLADLRKAIVLCHDCKQKFSARRHDYVSKSNLPFVSGRCDGCDRYSPMAVLFVHHTLAVNT